MLDLNPLCEFSRTYCIAICAFLVPANLLATLQTMVFIWLDRPIVQIRWMTAIASLYALLMISHVATWFMIGVVMIPTYVLMWLGCTCIAINFWAIVHPVSMKQLFQTLQQWALTLKLPDRSSLFLKLWKIPN